MYDFDYTEIQNDAEQTAKPNPRKIRWQIIVAIAGTFVLMAGLIWFMFAGIKIIFPDYIAGNTMIKAGGKYIFIQDGIIQYKGGVTDDPKAIIGAEAESTLLSNGKTVYYVENGDICSVELDGKDAKVIRESEQNITLVHRYHDLLYYIAGNGEAGKLSLCRIDLKTGEETAIDGIDPATRDFYVYDDKLYYLCLDSSNQTYSCTVWMFDFKIQEPVSFLKNADLCVNKGYGEQPLFCEYKYTTAEEYCFPVALYQNKDDKAEKIADFPENVKIACAPGRNDDILLYRVEFKDDHYAPSGMLLFNSKTGETKELSADLTLPAYAVQDWAHPEQIYVFSLTESNSVLNGNSILDRIYLIKDGELKECVANGSAVADPACMAVIDGYFIDMDFNGHQVAVKQHVN